MDFESLLGNAKWDMLAAVATGPKAATEVAKLARTSLANISQQGRLLEAWGLVRLKQEAKDGPGKPRRIYSLGKELAHVAMVRKGFAGKRGIPLDAHHRAVMNIWFLPKTDDHYLLQKYLWQHEDLIASIEAMSVVDSNQSEIHLLIIASDAKLEMLRKEFSKVEVHGPDGKKSVIAWTHSRDELEEGLRRGDDYFRNLVKAPHVIIDVEGIIGGLKQ